jgi:uncharacterized LabA/DUF88 family protein
MPDKTAVFIDAGYLKKINTVKIDFEKLVREMIGTKELHRAYYYDCPPFMPPNPDADDKTRLSRATQFHQRLKSIPRFDVRLGKLRCKGYDSEKLPIFEQKRVDLLLGLDIASVIRTIPRVVDSIFMLTGDGDMLPAMIAAKEAQVIVCLAHGIKSTYDQELWDCADDRLLLDASFFQKIRLAP